MEQDHSARNKFAKNLKELRLAYNLSQYQLACKLNLPQRSVSNWENGKNASIDALILLADFFDVTIDDLVGR